jgi:hypothetical protein
MGDQSMRLCVQQQLEIIRDTLPSHVALDAWVEGAASNDIDLDVPLATAPARLRAWGYIEGAADAVDLTVREMLDWLDIKLHSFDAPRAQKLRRLRDAILALPAPARAPKRRR